MRLSDVLTMQYIEAGGMPDFYNLEKLGDEVPLTKEEMARLWVGLTYFVQSDNELREQVVEALRALTGQAREDARTVLIGTLGTLGLQDSTTPAGVPQ